jgi:hypothetical protein
LTVRVSWHSTDYSKGCTTNNLFLVPGSLFLERVPCSAVDFLVPPSSGEFRFLGPCTMLSRAIAGARSESGAHAEQTSAGNTKLDREASKKLARF